jgi:hypothetical protein
MRFPIPLILALAVVIGSVMVMVVQMRVVALGSWDPRYAAFNGTHVYQTGLTPNVPYKTLYLGYGTAYFQNPVNVYYLERVRSGSTGGLADLGRYLPVRVIIESGSLPTDTYIAWTDPLSGVTRKMYFFGGTDRGVVIGTYQLPSLGVVIAGILVHYRVEGSEVLIYPMTATLSSTIANSQVCPVLRSSGLASTSQYHLFVVTRNTYFPCGSTLWSTATPGWTMVASLVTTATLRPSPQPYYVVDATVGSSRLKIILSYWYAINADPGSFVVKVG